MDNRYRPHRRPALLALQACLASAWVTVPTMPDGATQDYKLLWSMPANATDDSGLGGGIAFAIDPSFCSTVRPFFREDKQGDVAFKPFTWVTCEEINDALARAMSTWSANHPYIKWYNVTDECEGRAFSDCTVAELWITADIAPEGVEDVAAYVEYVEPSGGWRSGPRTTAGARPLASRARVLARGHLGLAASA
jgi:hypothetical protein